MQTHLSNSHLNRPVFLTMARGCLPTLPHPTFQSSYLSGKKKAQQSYKYFNNVLRDQLFSVNKPNEAWLIVLSQSRAEGKGPLLALTGASSGFAGAEQNLAGYWLTSPASSPRWVSLLCCLFLYTVCINTCVYVDRDVLHMHTLGYRRTQPP